MLRSIGFRGDNHRGKALRDQSNTGITAAALFVMAMLVAACGAGEETAKADLSVSVQSVRDVAPSWEPNQAVLDEILRDREADSAAIVVQSAGYSVFAGPPWQPDYDLLESILGKTQSVGNTEPIGEPNQRLLESILNKQFADQPSGPR